MELHQVRYFLSVCETLNFTRAAEECNVAQPSLSRAIKLLEMELGGDLFRRERSLTHLTELGRSVQPSLRQCFDAALSAKALAKAYHKEGNATLHLALSRSLDMSLLSSHLREISSAFPKIQIKLFRGSCTEIAEKLRNGDVEVAIAGPLEDDWERFDAKPLFVEKYGVLVTRQHSLANQNFINLEALVGLNIISCANCTMAERLLKELERSGAVEIACHQVPLPDDIVDLVRTGSGVGILSLARHVPMDLSVCVLEGIELAREIQLITVAGRQRTPATTALVSLLRSRDWSQAFDPSGRPVEAAA